MAKSSRSLYMGLLGGMVATLLLAFPLYGSLPQSYVAAERARALSPDAGSVVPADVPIWPAPSSLDLTLYFLGAVVVAAAGFAAARGEVGALRRLSAGAMAGIIAGMVVWLGVGAAAAGVVGHAPIWLNGARAVDGDQLRILLSEAVIRSTWLVPISLGVTIGVAVAAGLLGGLVRARWRSGSEEPGRAISVATQLRVGLTLLIVTFVTLIVAIGLLSILEETTRRAASETSHQLGFPAAGLTGLPTGGMLALAAALSWRTWRLIPANGMHRWYSPGVLASVAVILLQIGSLAILVLINPQGALRPISIIGFTALALSTAVGLPLATRARRRPDLPPERAAVWQDWLDTLVLISLGGATIIMAGVVALALSLVLGAIVFIGVLSGPVTGGAGAIPTVAGSVESMYAGSLIAVVVALLLPLVSLPVYLTYDGLRFAYGRLREWWVWMIAGLSGLGTGVIVGGLIGGLLALCVSALSTLAGHTNPSASSLAGSVITLVWLGMPAWLGLAGLVGGQGIALGLEPDRLRRWVRGAATSGALGLLALWVNYNWGGEGGLAPIMLAAAGGVLVFQWQALRGAYPWARWWPWVNLGCAALASLVGMGALSAYPNYW